MTQTATIVADTTGMTPRAADRYLATLRKYESKKELIKEGAQAAASTALAFATGLGIGYIEGRYPERAEIMGVPIAMAVGAFGLAGSIFLPEEYAVYARDVGNGAAAIAGRDIAADLGAKKRQNAQGAQQPAQLPAQTRSNVTAFPGAYQYAPVGRTG